MQKRMLAVLALMAAVVPTGCGKVTKSPTNPTQVELAATPSTQAPVMSIKIEREANPSADGQLRVTLGENFNQGMTTGFDDWNGAKVSLVRRCDGRDSQVIKDVQSGDVAEGTRKNVVIFTQIDSCNGEANFRLRAQKWGATEYVNFDFPRGVYWLNTGFRITKDQAGLAWITGKL